MIFSVVTFLLKALCTVMMLIMSSTVSGRSARKVERARCNDLMRQ